MSEYWKPGSQKSSNASDGHSHPLWCSHYSGIPFTSGKVASAVGTTPAPPGSFSGSCSDANNSSGQISLTFTPGSNGGSPITNYKYSFDDITFTAFDPATTTQPFVFDFTAYNRPLGW